MVSAMKNLHNPTKRVLDILLTLSDVDGGISQAQICEKTNIPKSTISPILKTMVEMGFLNLSNGLYKVGIESFKVGEAFLRSTSGLEIITSYMKAIVDECNEICQLGIYTDQGVLYLEKIEPVRSIKLASSVGSTLPHYATALGKALISQFDNDTLRAMFAGKMQKFTKNTITDIDRLIEDIESVRRNSYATEYGEISDHTQCAAIPIVQDDRVLAAISVSVPSFRSSKAEIEKMAHILLKYKALIEDDIAGMNIELK